MPRHLKHLSPKLKIDKVAKAGVEPTVIKKADSVKEWTSDRVNLAKINYRTTGE